MSGNCERQQLRKKGDDLWVSQSAWSRAKNPFARTTVPLLQGYALYRTLSSLGYETNILRYKSGPAHTRDSLLNRVRRVVMGNDLRAIVQKVKFRANQKPMTEDHKKRYQLFLSFQHEHMTFATANG